MGTASVRQANEAAISWPPDGAATAQRAEIAQRKGLPQASSSQPTEAEKQGNAFIATMEKLPEFIRAHNGCMLTRNKIVLELAQYNKYILGQPPDLKPADANLREKLLDDIRAQGDRISLETLKRLANVKDLAGVRDELKRVSNEVAGLIKKGERTPTSLAEYCLTLQINILIARSTQFKGPFERSTFDEVKALLKDLKSGIGNQLHKRATHPYDRRGAI